MTQTLQFVVVTGLSGAGKTQALRALEDLGFFCVDNLPPALMGTFADLCQNSRQTIERVGLVMDVRGGDFFGDLLEAVEALRSRGLRYRVVYLEADENVLLRRFEETRRRHPVSSGGGLADSIRDEREMLLNVRARADYIVNTTDLPPNLLKRKLAAAFTEIQSTESLQVQVVSFGFKHGLPAVCDLVFDLRFLPNPYHVPELRMQSGLDAEVREFVLGSQAGSEFQEHFREFLRYVIPQYAEEGKAYLTIGIGCTGGRHRSVAAAEATAAWIRSLGYTVTVRHRDLRREGRRATDRARGEPGVEAAVPSLPDNHPVDTAVRPSIERRSGE